MTMRYALAVLCVCLLLPGAALGAREAIYGLESVKFDKIYDPSVRPERLRLVSGSLKLTGGYPRGNVWQAVTYIPRLAAAPKTDYGVFWTAGDRIYFYSFVTFSSYYGTALEGGERIVVVKISRYGQSQTEVWYLDR